MRTIPHTTANPGEEVDTDGRNLAFSFVTYHTNQYKLHYYETPTNIKFVMLTDLKSPSMRIALQQIYINLYVEYGMQAHELEDFTGR